MPQIEPSHFFPEFWKVFAAYGAGAEKVYDLGELTEFEEAGLKDAIPELKASIQKGIEFGQSG